MARVDNRNGQTLTDKAYRVIEEKIITQELAPGELMSEISLAEELNFGRTPVREALQRLAQGGLINILPRRGVMVSDINVGAQLRMLEVRRGIENILARSAATRATDAERGEFEQLANQFRKSAADDDDILFMRIDKEFNELVARTARNEFAEKAIGLMSGLSRRFYYRYYRELVDLQNSANLHANVAEAISVKNAEQAALASDALMDHIVDLTRRAMDY
jgi:DNA-binding GntR family transcriptional regulator